MFEKIAIANRNEIAYRVIKTCRSEARKRICHSLVMLRDKKLENPWRKHGNIPL